MLTPVNRHHSPHDSPAGQPRFNTAPRLCYPASHPPIRKERTPVLWNAISPEFMHSPWLEEDDRHWSLDDVLEHARKAGDNFAWLGIYSPGTVTPFQAVTTAGSVKYLFSVLAAGGVPLPLNPRFPGHYLHDLLQHVATGSLPRNPAPGIGLDAPATLVLTSGTSHRPKAVAHTLRAHLASAAAANHNLPLAPGDRWLCSLPLYHVSGLAILFRCLRAGATVVFPTQESDLLSSLAKHNITHCSLVPAQLHRLLDTPGGAEALKRLKGILLGGSALPSTLR